MKKAGKVLALFFVSLVFVSVLANFVAAQTWADSVAGFFESIGAATKPIFDLAVGGSTVPGEGAIAILTFFLISLVIYGVLSGVKIFGDRNWLNILVGVIVALIGVRVLPEGFLMLMAQPSGALAGGLLLIIPFIIVAAMVVKLENSMIRRVLWAIYGTLIAVLWVYNISNPAMKPVWFIYPLIALVCLIALIWDQPFIRFWNRVRARGEGEEAVKRLKLDARGKLVQRIDNHRAEQSTLDPVKDKAKYNKMQAEIERWELALAEGRY